MFHRLQVPVALVLATLVSACAVSAKDGSSIHYRVDADAGRRVTTFTCKASSTQQCIFWIGDPTAAHHKDVHVAAGASVEVPGDDADARYCGDVVETRMAWPGCTTTPNGGRLDKSSSRDWIDW